MSIFEKIGKLKSIAEGTQVVGCPYRYNKERLGQRNCTCNPCSKAPKKKRKRCITDGGSHK